MDQKRCPPFLTCPYNRCLSHYADKRFNGVGQQIELHNINFSLSIQFQLFYSPSYQYQYQYQ